MADLNPAALTPLEPGAAAAIEAATGCSIAELLALPEPGWDVLARFAGPMLGMAAPLPEIAALLAESGHPATAWAAAFAAAVFKESDDDE